MIKLKRTIEIRANEAHFSELPKDIVQCLSEAEKEAYVEGAMSFHKLAERLQNAAFKTQPGRLDEDQPVTLYMYSVDETPFRNYFGFTLMPEGRHPKIRLPQIGNHLESVPNPVKTVYSIVGGLMEPWADYAGLIPPEDFHSFDDYWIEDAGGIDPSRSLCFYYDGGGDAVGFDTNGNGVSYEHEEGLLQPIDLKDFCGSYFDWALER